MKLQNMESLVMIHDTDAGIVVRSGGIDSILPFTLGGEPKK
jgi:hypothetical protein